MTKHHQTKTMKPILLFTMTVLLTFVRSVALSVSLPAPDIFFAKHGDTNRQAQVLSVLRTEGLNYVGGLTSYWEPDFATTLVYDSAPKTLNQVLARLTAIPGFTVKVTFARDLAKETGGALRAGTWWVIYRHSRPEAVEVRINLAAGGFALEELVLESSVRP